MRKIYFPYKPCATIPVCFLKRERNDITPNVHFTTWDDYEIMSMMGGGLGIAILPELILRRIPYKSIAKELDISAYHKIGIVLRSQVRASLAVKKFFYIKKYLSMGTEKKGRQRIHD